jgi:predicted dithiol-disulfide oxidoreductase (DUF899 family)
MDTTSLRHSRAGSAPSGSFTGAKSLRVLGHPDQASLYLDRCQVDTPHDLVRTVWALLGKRRRHAGKVIDFGAGDCRFAANGKFASYVGYEIDPRRCRGILLPPKATLVNSCAFTQPITDASTCLGNPPFVRNQDLPSGWRQQAAEEIKRRTGVKISGLANAWQYFMFLALASTRPDGIVALIIPFEWVSRPSSASLREFIRRNGWAVDVYRLADDRFDRVLTTSSITIIDKKDASGQWRYFREEAPSEFSAMRTVSGGRRKPLEYRDGRALKAENVQAAAKRGLSPGTQEYLTLTEGERARNALKVGDDVVPCVTSLRNYPASATILNRASFQRWFVSAGRKCWLIRTDRALSAQVRAYLDAVPKEGRNNWTCNSREEWWKFAFPTVPQALVASGFREGKPKMVLNGVRAHAIGGVCGIYCKSQKLAATILRKLRTVDYDGRVVAHANGLRKLEINQLNTLIADVQKK